MLAHVPSFGRNPRGSPDFLAYPVPKACMHVLGTGVPRCLGVARSASSPKAAQALGCSLTPGLRISFGRVTCMARAASVPGLWTLGFLLLCGACVWVWVVVGCVCLGSGLGCARPLLAGVLGCVCAHPSGPLAPSHSWHGCAVWVCVFGLGSRLRPATPGWGVGVCVFVCVLRLHPATPGTGARRGCVRFGSGFGFAPPLLAGVLGCVCAHVRALLPPSHSWPGCAVWVCVFGLGFRLRPATPGWGVRVCVFVCVLRLHPATPGTGARCGCVCLGWGFGCAPPLLAGVLGCVCAGVRAPLAPSHSWHGCAVSLCVFGLGFQLRPATPG